MRIEHFCTDIGAIYTHGLMQKYVHGNIGPGLHTYVRIDMGTASKKDKISSTQTVTHSQPPLIGTCTQNSIKAYVYAIHGHINAQARVHSGARCTHPKIHIFSI